VHRNVDEAEVPLVKGDGAVLVHALCGLETSESVFRYRVELDIFRLAFRCHLPGDAGSGLGLRKGVIVELDLFVGSVHEVQFDDDGSKGGTLVGELKQKTTHTLGCRCATVDNWVRWSDLGGVHVEPEMTHIPQGDLFLAIPAHEDQIKILTHKQLPLCGRSPDEKGSGTEGIFVVQDVSWLVLGQPRHFCRFHHGGSGPKHELVKWGLWVETEMAESLRREGGKQDCLVRRCRWLS